MASVVSYTSSSAETSPSVRPPKYNQPAQPVEVVISEMDPAAVLVGAVEVDRSLSCMAEHTPIPEPLPQPVEPVELMGTMDWVEPVEPGRFVLLNSLLARSSIARPIGHFLILWKHLRNLLLGVSILTEKDAYLVERHEGQILKYVGLALLKLNPT